MTDIIKHTTNSTKQIIESFINKITITQNEDNSFIDINMENMTNMTNMPNMPTDNYFEDDITYTI